MPRLSRRTCLKAASCATALSFFGAARAAENANAKLLTVYFSWSGSSKTVAEKVRRLAGGDILRLKTVEPYPAEYRHDGAGEKGAGGKRAASPQDRPPRPFRLRHDCSRASDLGRSHADARAYLPRRRRLVGKARGARDDPRRKRTRPKSRGAGANRTEGRIARSARRVRMARRSGSRKRRRLAQSHRSRRVSYPPFAALSLPLIASVHPGTCREAGPST